MDMWRQIESVIRRNRSFLVTTHVFPDGDAIGSQVALAHVLRKLGKKVLAVNEHPVPQIYRFLDPRRSIKVYTGKLIGRIARCDAAFVVDVNSLERTGLVGRAIREASIRTLCIDHHRTRSSVPGVNVLDPSAASTGEMIYGLARSLRVPITPPIAASLFVAIATDTGWFRYPNTTPLTLEIAAELVKRGARPDKIHASTYEMFEWRRLDLMRFVLATLRRACGGRIAYFYVTRKMLRQTGADYEDTEGFTDIPRVLRPVQLILFFRETGDGIKVSLRSKSGPPIEALARKHGGGGHARAAGALIKAPLDKAIKTMLADARRLLAEHGDR